ncbi:hypothetical protein NG99_01275 [Erwinia typographi]|uniref:Uncharacterized protein n=1 Tax=Erwinia typographi TaxID=371042 RepID=A0A0A3Z9N2_9GAMM|nr:hypothetical protein [Erwinia typographi]KGT95802.1 hypothetical protein NG99_01275 [Erwinia typographi]
MKITFETSGKTVTWNLDGDDEEVLKQVLNITGCARVFNVSRDVIAHRVYRKKMPVLLALATEESEQD